MMRSIIVAALMAGLLSGMLMLACGCSSKIKADKDSAAKTNGGNEEPSGDNDAKKPGTEEFGLTPKQLVEAVEKVEGFIAKYMREEGFEYIPCDFQTIRKGMTADKIMPGMTEEEFIKKYGFGVSTSYTGKPPQLAEGYCPAREGLGERNIAIFKKLSPADQVAYNRALLGENTDATFAVGLETENFSRCGGCTRKAIEQVFKPDELKPDYYNPKDALIKKHPMMKLALDQFRREMRDAGYSYAHPDEVEPDIRTRLAAITKNGTIPVEKMTAEQLEALKQLQDYERRVAVLNFDLQDRVFDPVEERIQRSLYPREVK
jgi:hypothetical protein